MIRLSGRLSTPPRSAHVASSWQLGTLCTACCCDRDVWPHVAEKAKSASVTHTPLRDYFPCSKTVRPAEQARHHFPVRSREDDNPS